MKTLFLLVVMLVQLTPMQTVPAFAQGETAEGDTTTEMRHTVFMPLVTSGVDQAASADIPSAEELAAEVQRKFSYVPITAEWVAAHSAWFASEMERLQNTVQASQVDTLDNDTLEAMFDFSTAPVSTELQAFMENHEVQAAGGVGDSRNDVNLGVTRNGDILLGYNPGGHFGSIPVPISAWGWWRHAAIVRGTTMVHAPNPGIPVSVQARNLWQGWFDAGAALRTTASEATRNAAAEYAFAQRGESYSWWSPKFTEDAWYCSKLIWSAYYWNTPWWARHDLDPNEGY